MSNGDTTIQRNLTELCDFKFYWHKWFRFCVFYLYCICYIPSIICDIICAFPFFFTLLEGHVSQYLKITFNGSYLLFFIYIFLISLSFSSFYFVNDIFFTLSSIHSSLCIILFVYEHFILFS